MKQHGDLNREMVSTCSTLLGLAGLFLSGVAGAAEQPKPVWQMTEAEIIEEVSTARAGRQLLQPAQWPGGARVAVLFSFDVDNETENLSLGDYSIFGDSFHEYGARAGLRRIVNMLDKHEIPASFFIPVMSNVIAPYQLPIIMKSGRHEIGVHGWVHGRADQMPPELHREMIERAVNYWEAQTGKKPAGYRAPWADVTSETFAFVKEMGFLYDSSMLADDMPYEIVYKGEASGLVEVPISLILEDSPLNVATTFVAGIHTPEEMFEIWKSEFDVALEEGTTWVLVAHPHVIGHRSRAAMLERLIVHMKSTGKAWFATHEAVARLAAEQL